MLGNVADLFVLNKQYYINFMDAVLVRLCYSHSNFSFEENFIITINVISFSQGTIMLYNEAFHQYFFVVIFSRCRADTLSIFNDKEKGNNQNFFLYIHNSQTY